MMRLDREFTYAWAREVARDGVPRDVADEVVLAANAAADGDFLRAFKLMRDLADEVRRKERVRGDMAGELKDAVRRLRRAADSGRPVAFEVAFGNLVDVIEGVYTGDVGFGHGVDESAVVSVIDMLMESGD